MLCKTETPMPQSLALLPQRENTQVRKPAILKSSSHVHHTVSMNVCEMFLNNCILGDRGGPEHCIKSGLGL